MTGVLTSARQRSDRSDLSAHQATPPPGTGDNGRPTGVLCQVRDGRPVPRDSVLPSLANQMPRQRLEHRMRPITRIKLPQHIRQMILHRPNRNVEKTSNLLVGIPTRHQPQDRSLLRREPRPSQLLCLLPNGRHRSRLKNSLSPDCGLEHSLQRLRLSVFQQITRSARADAFLLCALLHHRPFSAPIKSRTRRLHPAAVLLRP